VLFAQTHIIYHYICVVSKNNYTMKPILNLLLVAILATNVSSGKANTTFKRYTYTIHVGAFIKAKISDFENIRQYGYLYSQQLNSLQQVYIGDYETEIAANEVMQKIKAAGYLDAFITRRNLDDGNTVLVVQLATEKSGDEINWAKYVKAGPLLALITGNSVKVLTGPFEDLNSAKQQLKVIKKAGFSDAFMKNVNEVLLHAVTDFETGGSVQIPDNFETVVFQEKEIADKKPVSIKPEVTTRPKAEAIPKSYDVITMMPKATLAPKTTPVPKIRKNVKRTSVLKLQEVLKSSGNYKSSLDGLYGPGTAKAYDQMMANNREIQKYKLLAKYAPVEKPKPKVSPLQKAINSLIDDSANALKTLQGSKAPIAKAYRAYAKFVSSGPQKAVNDLMNASIKEAFQAKKLKNRPPFDFTVTYAYNDLGQLIKHLRYIQSAAEKEIAVPCWIFQRHPEEALAAYEPYQNLSPASYRIQDCAGSLDWESLKLLETIVNDLNPSPEKSDAAVLADNQSKRSRIILAPKPLQKNDYHKIDNWNTSLWNGLKKWEASDALHNRMTMPLKVAYFQSWALLEDYFMDKGFSSKDARGLSLCVLQTIVEPGLNSYKE